MSNYDFYLFVYKRVDGIEETRPISFNKSACPKEYAIAVLNVKNQKYQNGSSIPDYKSITIYKLNVGDLLHDRVSLPPR